MADCLFIDMTFELTSDFPAHSRRPIVQPKQGVSEMYTMSVLCTILCALCLPFLVFGQDTCSCTIIGNGCDFTNKYNHPTKQNRENIALGKPAVSSSTKRDIHPGYGQYVNQQGCLANNGNRTSYLEYYFRNSNTANCVHTSLQDPTPKWTVNLLRKYAILEIAIYSRIHLARRMIEANIWVDNQLCHRIITEPPEVLYFKCKTTLTGQNISISKSVPKDKPSLHDHTLNICEVEVWICREGYYGEDCNMRCEGCKDYCYHNGSCLTKACEPGFYGAGCTLKCGACKGGSCAANGSCTNGCEDGWLGDKCMEACEAGYNGSGCTLNCGACKGGSCGDKGSCTNGCEDGWEGDKCKQEVAASSKASGSNLEIILGIFDGMLALLAGLLFILARRIKKEEKRNWLRS